ncbi:hypothetical protein PA905_10470 [Planktothrix agardhii CCAP 1459/11A]|uniref:Uncharacterized protein n=1 Tax=Planktothrix agardhii CCAP 1459/11A TaxID=282420 RepID=A0A4P5ZIT7_PLAAG|nr:hypothetical protein PA905_10470 [Planktothrix agardhii CCAP 1459/11A]CAD5971779.1 hypothetical protein PCC7821_03827 [Planktothrix rubescens NIVA-CYA 18]CAH2574374.1 hypothetical protein PRNO82_03734 [Planktothrix rubescens]
MDRKGRYNYLYYSHQRYPYDQATTYFSGSTGHYS